MRGKDVAEEVEVESDGGKEELKFHGFEVLEKKGEVSAPHSSPPHLPWPSRLAPTCPRRQPCRPWNLELNYKHHRHSVEGSRQPHSIFVAAMAIPWDS